MVLTNNRLIPRSRGRHNSCSVESQDLRRPGQHIWAEVILNVLYKYFYVVTCPVLWTQYSSSASPACRWGGPGTCWSTGTCPGWWRRRARSGSFWTQTVRSQHYYDGLNTSPFRVSVSRLLLDHPRRWSCCCCCCCVAAPLARVLGQDCVTNVSAITMSQPRLFFTDY